MNFRCELYFYFEKSMRQARLLHSHDFKCNCNACENNYSLMNESTSKFNSMAMKAMKDIEMFQLLEKTVGLKTPMFKLMFQNCIKNLQSISDADRTVHENRGDVIMLRELLRGLLATCDTSQFTIRK